VFARDGWPRSRERAAPLWERELLGQQESVVIGPFLGGDLLVAVESVFIEPLPEELLVSIGQCPRKVGASLFAAAPERLLGEAVGAEFEKGDPPLSGMQHTKIVAASGMHDAAPLPLNSLESTTSGNGDNLEHTASIDLATVSVVAHELPGLRRLQGDFLLVIDVRGFEHTAPLFNCADGSLFVSTRRDRGTRVLEQARSRSTLSVFIGSAELICIEPDCNLRTIVVEIRELFDGPTTSGLFYCPACGNVLALRHVETLEERRAADEASARRSVNQQIWRAEHPDEAVPIEVMLDDRLPDWRTP
jgi:hypothetical protein